MSDGLTRRLFLGAAAAASLPVGMGDAAGRDGDQDGADRREHVVTPDVPEEFPQEHTFDDPTSWFEFQVGERDVNLHILAYPHQPEKQVQVEMRVRPGVRMVTEFSPDEARDVAATLEDAADEVEAWRADPPEEWEEWL